LLTTVAHLAVLLDVVGGTQQPTLDLGSPDVGA
jgi:hypothetical protein